MTVCKIPHLWDIHSSASLVAFFPVLTCVLGCGCRDKPSWRVQLKCVCVGNQRSRGVLIARLRSSVRSLLHQRRDLHQSTYLYLSKDREPTSHQVVTDFRLSVRYYRVLLISFCLCTKLHQKRQKQLYTFRCPIALRATIFIFSCFVEFVFIVVKSCY
jgi:hypothetical protein